MAPRAARVGALIGAFTLFPLAASRAQVPATTPDSPRGVQAPAIAPGTRVRVTTDHATTLPPGTALDDAGVQAEGQFVRFDSAAVVVRLRGGVPYTIPATSVRRLEMRSGPGLCATSAAARVGCVLVGVAGGLAIGRVAGNGQGDAAGAAVGLGIGVAVALSVGRDRWVPVDGWPSTR